MDENKRVLDRLVIAEGTDVFTEGERGDRAYVVQDGIIEIVRKDEYGNLFILGTVEKGGIFGEMALIDDQPRARRSPQPLSRSLAACSPKSWPSATLSFAACLGYSYATSARWPKVIRFALV